MIIDENQLSSAHNILSISALEIKTTKETPHNIRLKRLLLKASSYLSIGQFTKLVENGICSQHKLVNNSKNHLDPKKGTYKVTGLSLKDILAKINLWMTLLMIAYLKKFGVTRTRTSYGRPWDMHQRQYSNKKPMLIWYKCRIRNKYTVALKKIIKHMSTKNVNKIESRYSYWLWSLLINADPIEKNGDPNYYSFWLRTLLKKWGPFDSKRTPR